MASAISTMLTAYRASLVTDTGLANMPENVEIEDPPASLFHRKFVLVIASPTRDRESHGGGTYEYEIDVNLVVAFAKNVDEEALQNTIADDLIDADVSMLKASNRSAGTLRVFKNNSGGLEEGEDVIFLTTGFTVICRETKDLT